MDILSELVTKITLMVCLSDREIARRAVNRVLADQGFVKIPATEVGTEEVFHLSTTNLHDSRTGGVELDPEWITEMVGQLPRTKAAAKTTKGKAKTTKVKATQPAWSQAFDLAFAKAPAGKQRQSGKRAYALVRYHDLDVTTAVDEAIRQVLGGLTIEGKKR